MFTFCQHRLSEILKTDFFRKILEKTAISERNCRLHNKMRKIRKFKF